MYRKRHTELKPPTTANMVWYGVRTICFSTQMPNYSADKHDSFFFLLQKSKCHWLETTSATTSIADSDSNSSYPCRRFAVPCLARCLTAAHAHITLVVSLSLSSLSFVSATSAKDSTLTQTCEHTKQPTDRCEPIHKHILSHTHTHIVAVIVIVIRQSQTTNALEGRVPGM